MLVVSNAKAMKPLVAVEWQAVMDDQPLAIVDGKHGDVFRSWRGNLRIPEQVPVEAARLREIARLEGHVSDTDDLRARRLNGPRLVTPNGDSRCHQNDERQGLIQRLHAAVADAGSTDPVYIGVSDRPQAPGSRSLLLVLVQHLRL